MASSSQRVYTSCSLFLSLSLRIQFNFSLISRLDTEWGSLCLSFVATILSDVFVSGFWQPRGDLGELYREYYMCAKTKHLCLKTVRNIGMRKPYTNICTSYVVSVSNAPRVAFDCLCFTYTTVHVKLTLTYYKFTWMYCKSVYVNTCSTIS